MQISQTTSSWKSSITTTYRRTCCVALLAQAIFADRGTPPRLTLLASLPAMEEATVNRLATSITRLTLSQVTTDEIDAAKLLDEACQKLRGIPDVPPQRITDL